MVDLPAAAENILLLEPMLEPGQPGLEADEAGHLPREDVIQPGHIVVDEAARLIHLRQQLHLLNAPRLFR